MPINDTLASEQWTRFQYCVSGAAEVLTKDGFVRLGDITLGHRVYDGHNFVKHDGLLFKGVKQTIDVGGVRMTPEHKVVRNNHWVEARTLRHTVCGEEPVYDLLN